MCSGLYMYVKWKTGRTFGFVCWENCQLVQLLNNIYQKFVNALEKRKEKELKCTMSICSFIS